MSSYYRIFLVIFLCSASSLAYEIALTRIFSVSLWYHFAFMIISIAMLGIGTSGTVLSLSSRLKNLSYVGIYSLLLGITISVSYIISNHVPFDPVRLSWSKIQIFYIGAYYLILSVPFFFTGLIIATSFYELSGKSGLVYGADLTGAGAGSIGVLLLTTFVAPENIVFLISSIALTASFIIGSKKLKVISFFLILLNIVILFFQPHFISLRMSPYKGLSTALRHPGAEHLKTYFSPYSRIDTFKSPAARFAPGLSFRYLEELPEQIGFSVDGGDLNAITAYDGMSSPPFIDYLPSALPYKIIMDEQLNKGKKPPDINDKRKKSSEDMKEVLILDPKGGLQCLVAENFGRLQVYKVESNPLIVEVIKKDYNDFSGGIYSTNTWTGLGRSWLSARNIKFDVIDISLTGASPSGIFGIAEDYRFTVEAFKEYVRHLKTDGIASINLFILPPSRTELRILTTAVRAMEELGIDELEKHFAAIRSWGTISLLIKKSAFTVSDIENLKSFSREMRFDLIFYPGIREEETNLYVRMPSNEYHQAFKDILNPESRTRFVREYLFDIAPVRDENPFFHYYLKFKNIGEIYRIMGEKWQYFIDEGYILPVIFTQILIFSVILLAIPVIPLIKNRNKVLASSIKKGIISGSSEPYSLYLLPYFAFLGIGFMFLEISMVHKMILPLENPSYAAATVLTSLLISSGIGSLLSYRIQTIRKPAVIIIIPILIILYSILLPGISDMVSTHSIPLKILFTSLFFMPVGIFMGIPFPLGLKILGENNESLIPWAWSINACFSVLSPVLTLMIAIGSGFRTVLWLGAFCYLLAFMVLNHFLKKLNQKKCRSQIQT